MLFKNSLGTWRCPDLKHRKESLSVALEFWSVRLDDGLFLLWEYLVGPLLPCGKKDWRISYVPVNRRRHSGSTSITVSLIGTELLRRLFTCSARCLSLGLQRLIHSSLV